MKTAIGIFLCIFLGHLSSLSATKSDFLWYEGLAKPALTPPNWVFGVVWTLLYGMMGIVFALLCKKPINRLLLSVFTLQFVLSLVWMPLFFLAHRTDWAFYDVVALFSCMALFMGMVRKKPKIFVLCLPYMVWLCFALFLSFSVYTL